MEATSGREDSPLPYATLISSDDHIDVFDVGSGDSDDRLHQLSESDYLLEAASELLQFVDGLDGLVIKTDGTEQGKSKEEPVSPPSHILDHNYASASPSPNTKKSNQNAHERRTEANKRVSSYSHGRHRNGTVF
uniref:Chaperone protein htpG n=1 Tax=Lygus hesperus TaxID=30085 RepID=A0A0A9Z8Z0_LYGHE